MSLNTLSVSLFHIDFLTMNSCTILIVDLSVTVCAPSSLQILGTIIIDLSAIALVQYTNDLGVDLKYRESE
jgi:hypothetical protein